MDDILSIIKKDEYNMTYINPKLFKNEQFMLKIIDINPWLIKYCGVIDNKKVIEKAVSKDGLILKYASEEIRNDREIVIKAINSDTNAIQFASDATKNNIDIANMVFDMNIASIKYLGEDILNNEEFINKVIDMNPAYFEYASFRLKNDYKMVTKVLNKSVNTYIYVGSKIMKDEIFIGFKNEFVKQLSDNDKEYIRYIDYIMIY